MPSAQPSGFPPRLSHRRWAAGLVLGGALGLSAFLAVRETSPHLPAPSGAPARSGPRRVRVVQSRETPRSPFFMGIEADLVDAGSVRIVLHLRSPQAGQAEVDFRLPAGAAAVEGELHRLCELDAGVNREERLLALVPDGAYHLIGIMASVDGRLSEAFVEIGEPPTAIEQGLRTRTRPDGSGVLRIGPEDLGE